jgi:hypothetical protein
MQFHELIADQIDIGSRTWTALLSGKQYTVPRGPFLCTGVAYRYLFQSCDRGLQQFFMRFVHA